MKKIKLVLIFCGLILFDIGVNAASKELKVSGNKIVNSTGDTVRLTGVNIQGLENNPYGDNTMLAVNEAFNNWNCNIVRVTLGQEYWFGYCGSDSTKYRNIVSQVVQEATDRNKYIILDLHWSDMGVRGQYNAQHKMPDDNSITFWKSVCSVFGNYFNVLFGLYNEPHSVTWDVWRNGGIVNDEGVTYHTPGMQAMVQAVRDAGAKNICIVGGLDWAYDLTGIANGYALVDRNTLGNYTGNGIMYDDHVYPWKNNWDTNVTCIAGSYPILIGECGYLDRGGNEPYQTWTPKLLDWLDEHQYHWTGWALNPNNGPTLIRDWNFAPTTEWGIYAKTKLLGYSKGKRK